MNFSSQWHIGRKYTKQNCEVPAKCGYNGMFKEQIEIGLTILFEITTDTCHSQFGCVLIKNITQMLEILFNFYLFPYSQ